MKTSRLLSLILILAMLLSVSAFAVSAPASGEDYHGKVVIIHTNDTHGGDVAVSGERLGTAGIAQLKKDYEAAGAKVILVSAGDAIQGAPIVNLSQGKTAIEFMNAAGYDLMVPGNHEFDWGLDNLLALQKQADFPMISTNILKADTIECQFPVDTVIDTDLGKVGFFGLTAPETSTSAHPDKIKGLTFAGGETMYSKAKTEVASLKAKGCDFIICVGHLGIDAGSAPNRSIDVINNVPGIDVFIDGHSHSVLDGSDPANKIGSTLLVSTGEKTENAGVVILSKDSISAGLISAADYTKVNDTVAAKISAVDGEVNAKLSEKFAVTEVLLNGERAPGVRTEETNLGDFAADAILWAANTALGDGKVDAALTNGGGIRASIPVGDVTMKDMATVFPYGNTIATVEVTGAQLLEALEAACYACPTAVGAFPQVSGMEFSLNTGVAYVNGALYGETTNYAPAKPGSRVLDVKIGGEALDLKKTYTIATNDFTAAGGDTYYVFGTCKKLDTGVALEDALVAYTSTVLGGTISAAKYGAPAGRIKLMSSTPAALTSFTDVPAGAWYEEYVKAAYDAKLMTGVSATAFAPDASVTRAMVVTMLYRLAGEPTITYVRAPDPIYSDITGDEYFASAANWAALMGIVEGTGVGADGLKIFSPDMNITREQLATMLYRYEQHNGGGYVGSWMFLLDVTDRADISDWAYESACWMSTNGVMQGINGAFKPADTATRAQLAKVFVTYSKMEHVVTQTPEAA